MCNHIKTKQKPSFKAWVKKHMTQSRVTQGWVVAWVDSQVMFCYDIYKYLIQVIRRVIIAFNNIDLSFILHMTSTSSDYSTLHSKCSKTWVAQLDSPNVGPEFIILKGT